MSIETEEHKVILQELRSSQDYHKHDVEIVLLKEQLREMKQDKEKASQWQMRLVGMLAGMAFSIIGSVMHSYSNLGILQEKIDEQKTEIKNLNQYIADSVAYIENNFVRKTN